MISEEDVLAHAASMVEQPWWPLVEAEMEANKMAQDPQIYRLEIRFDFYGTFEEAEKAAYNVMQLIPHDSQFIAMFDEDWNET